VLTALYQRPVFPVRGSSPDRPPLSLDFPMVCHEFCSGDRLSRGQASSEATRSSANCGLVRSLFQAGKIRIPCNVSIFLLGHFTP
jgi:hypothetical protein